jgi:hypothetical protein
VFLGTLAEARATLAGPSGTSLEEIFLAVTGDAQASGGARPAPAEPERN